MSDTPEPLLERVDALLELAVKLEDHLSGILEAVRRPTFSGTVPVLHNEPDPSGGTMPPAGAHEHAGDRMLIRAAKEALRAGEYELALGYLDSFLGGPP